MKTPTCKLTKKCNKKSRILKIWFDFMCHSRYTDKGRIFKTLLKKCFFDIFCCVICRRQYKFR